MKFAYRKRETFVVLDPGETKRFRLPPMTAGPILASIYGASVPGAPEPPDDDTGSDGGGVFNPDIVVHGGFEVSRGEGPNSAGTAMHAGEMFNLTEGSFSGEVPGGTVARDNPLGTHNPATDLEIDPGDGEGGGGSDPSPDVTLELRVGGGPVREAGDGHILFEANFDSEHWVLVFTAKPMPLPERRKYRVVLQYPSILPAEERRVPLSFLQQGFDKNWNDGHQYLTDFQIRNNTLHYSWDPQFAGLYHLDATSQFELPLGRSDWWIELPAILKTHGIRLEVGADSDPSSAPGGFQTPPSVYFALLVKARCEDSRDVHIRAAPDIELPREFWIRIKFYLSCTSNGYLYYQTKILTSLDLPYNPALDIVDKELPEVARAAEIKINARQWDEFGQTLFDKHLRPWMVGHYQVTHVGYDPATDELVFAHVGKPIERPIEASEQPAQPEPETMANPRMPRLFETASEVWAPTRHPGSDPTPQRRPETSAGALDKINHIVVLMQENRSFDQVLGYLSRDKGHAEVEGLLPGRTERDMNKYDRIEWRDQSSKFYSELITDTSWPADLDNPCHGHGCVMEQMADGMKHFVSNYGDSERLPFNAERKDAQRIMDYYGDEALPVYAALVREFAICDHWFGSHIGGTLPNRHITFCGDLNRNPQGTPEEENSEIGTYAPSERATFFDHLTERDISWRLYEHGYSFLRMYRKYTFDKYNIAGFSAFEEACKTGALPTVSFIEPDYIEAPNGNDDHAPADMFEGQRLVARILRAMIRSDRWANSMLIITYDEHGGFYDHLVPPDRIDVAQADGTVASRAIPPLANGIRQLGPRVPAFIISPFVAKGEGGVNVCKTVFEHASIPATIMRGFCSPRPAYLSDRVDQANDVRELLSLDTARPASDFTALLALLDETVDAEPSPELPKNFVPTRKKPPGTPGETEDFHGVIAYASTLTGRGAH
jgi:phospholipase C